MNKFTNPLNDIKIASPCSADWNEMIGSERRRFCGECKLNVYNLSGMTRVEAENLLIKSEGRLCVRFFKRADGSVLTKECPVGWQMVKHRVSKTATAFVSLIFGLFSGVGLNAFLSQYERGNAIGKMIVAPTIDEELSDEQLAGAIVVMPTEKVKVMPVMGKLAYPISGGIENIDEVRRQVRKNSRH